MSNELTLSGTMEYADSESADTTLQVAAKLASVSTKLYVQDKMSVTTSEVAIPLGSVSSLGWGFFINRDPTNYIELRVGTGGTKFAKLMPGEFAFFRFGSGITAPYAIANSAACQMEYLICSQ